MAQAITARREHRFPDGRNDYCIGSGMRRITATLGTALLLTVALACASAPPVRVSGSRADLESIAGEWTGTYSSPDTGREGSIWFKLIAGEDHAHGDVLMTPRGRSQPYRRYGPPGMTADQGPAEFLSIRFVKVSGQEVAGTLEPYLDPDCDCEARTEYRGGLTGDTFAGTFVTRRDNRVVTTGRWTATRHRSSK
jgi:hypothetical protein